MSRNSPFYIVSKNKIIIISDPPTPLRKSSSCEPLPCNPTCKDFISARIRWNMFVSVRFRTLSVIQVGPPPRSHTLEPRISDPQLRASSLGPPASDPQSRGALVSQPRNHSLRHPTLGAASGPQGFGLQSRVLNLLGDT